MFWSMPIQRITIPPGLRHVPAGKGQTDCRCQKLEAEEGQTRNMFLMIIVMALIVYAYYMGQLFSGIIAAAFAVHLFALYAAQRRMPWSPSCWWITTARRRRPMWMPPGLMPGHCWRDVRHDPFQSGGLETPSHERLSAAPSIKPTRSAVHRWVNFRPSHNRASSPPARRGLSNNRPEREKLRRPGEDRGRSCSFIMIAAGNLDAVRECILHSRSRTKAMVMRSTCGIPWRTPWRTGTS